MEGTTTETSKGTTHFYLLKTLLIVLACFSFQVAALVPQNEIDVSIGDVRKDLQSIIMSQGLRKIHYSLSNSETLIVFVNQVKTKIHNPFSFVF